MTDKEICEMIVAEKGDCNFLPSCNNCPLHNNENTVCATDKSARFLAELWLRDNEETKVTDEDICKELVRREGDCSFLDGCRNCPLDQGDNCDMEDSVTVKRALSWLTGASEESLVKQIIDENGECIFIDSCEECPLFFSSRPCESNEESLARATLWSFKHKQSPTEKVEDPSALCKACNAFISSDYKFCPNCGKTTIEDLTNPFFSVFNEFNHIPVGSQIWGGATEDSDFDFFIKSSEYYKLFDKCKKSERLHKLEFVNGGSMGHLYNIKSMKLTISSAIVVNLIVYEDEDFAKAKASARAMEALLEVPMLSERLTEKVNRVHIFRAICATIFGKVVEDIDDEYDL